jgi:hypothetical protein
MALALVNSSNPVSLFGKYHYGRNISERKKADDETGS